MNNQEYPEDNDPYKFYFQIDTEWIKKYMDSLINKIEYQTPLFPKGFSPTVLPVNSWFSSIVADKTSLYLGNNYWNEGVWKQKYFIRNKLQEEYVKHLQSHARHFLNQPRYYEGLYEILN
jgi:hypothetical protein